MVAKDRKVDKGKEVSSGEQVPFDFGAVAVKEATVLPKQSRKNSAPNPLEKTLQLSVDAGYKPMEFGPIPSSAVAQATSLMRRAARDAEYGISLREVKHDDGTVTIIFCAKQNKRARKYTVEEVRTWVNENYSTEDKEIAGYSEDKRVPSIIIKAYREAHGIK